MDLIMLSLVAFSRQYCAFHVESTSIERVRSMPGFLRIYGYYSPELKMWNIDVRLLVC